MNIMQVAKRGGGSLCSRLFLLKNRFLSDYVVPACPKYISGKLRSFSKILFTPREIYLLRSTCNLEKSSAAAACACAACAAWGDF